MLYTNYKKMHHCCKKGIAGKKANIRTLHPASQQRYTVARRQVMPNDSVRSGGTLKINPRKARMLSQKSCFISTTFFPKD